MLVKLEWLGYRKVKNYDDMLSRFHLIPERYEQTDKQTDARKDRIAISISRVSRDNKVIYYAFNVFTYRVGQIKRGQCSFFRRSKARFREYW